MKRISDIQIKNAAPHIFRRPFLFVEPNTRMRQIATFFAIGPQIYIDGLVVVSDNDKGQGVRPMGRIMSKHLISNILNSDYPEWLETKASQIMDSNVRALEMDSMLSSALEVFDKTRFGFVPIVMNRGEGRNGLRGSGRVTAVLTIRDILPLVAKAKLTLPIKKIWSPLVSIDGTTSITKALSYMISMSIRNIGIYDELSIHGSPRVDSSGLNRRKSEILHIINDRKILEFLFSHNGREILRKNGTEGLRDISIINHVDVIFATQVQSGISVSKAAEFLMDIHTPCLISRGNTETTDNYIVTPWDIVMNTLEHDSVLGSR